MMRCASPIAITSLAIALWSAQARTEPPSTSGSPPEPERHDASMMIAGQVLTGFGALSALVVKEPRSDQ